jgi:hypothetical protein
VDVKWNISGNKKCPKHLAESYKGKYHLIRWKILIKCTFDGLGRLACSVAELSFFAIQMALTLSKFVLNLLRKEYSDGILWSR